MYMSCADWNLIFSIGRASVPAQTQHARKPAVTKKQNFNCVRYGLCFAPFFLTVVASLGFASAAEDVVIRPRNEPDVRPLSAEAGTMPIPAEKLDFVKDALRQAKLLGGAAAAESAPAALSEFKRMSADVVPVLAEAAKAKNVSDAEIRGGALKGLEALQAKDRQVSSALAYASIFDPEKSIRAFALELVKKQNDKAAMGEMLQTLIGAYNANGEIADQPVHMLAADALRALNAREVYESLLYYVVLETRATQTELANMAQRQIDAYTVNSGANANLVLNLSFPIQFPELRITRVRTTVCIPAVALKSISGQDFGLDADRWRAWIVKQ
jgi:hypothetical protein